MARKSERDTWRKTKGGGYTRSLGERSGRVRLFQNRSGGLFYAAVWQPGKGVTHKCLGTTDRHDADRAGDLLLSDLLQRKHAVARGGVPLALLWEHYRTNGVKFRRYTVSMRKDIESRYKILAGYFGEGCDVTELTENDLEAYTEQRLAGGIIYGKNLDGTDKVTRQVSPRSANADIETLKAMCKWAMNFRLPAGGRLLQRHPLAGMDSPGRGNKQRRPVATHERFIATRNAITGLANAAKYNEDRQRWLQLELALVLAEATGRRIGSIRQLKWSDFDFVNQTMVWRDDADKMDEEWVASIPTAIVGDLLGFREKLGGRFGGLVFPSPTDRDKPISTDLLADWLVKAEGNAGLPKLDGSVWHAYRRSWATARKHLPRVDVAKAGGWKDPRMLDTYQRPDATTTRAVMDYTGKVHESGVAVTA